MLHPDSVKSRAGCRGNPHPLRRRCPSSRVQSSSQRCCAPSPAAFGRLAVQSRFGQSERVRHLNARLREQHPVPQASKRTHDGRPSNQQRRSSLPPRLQDLDLRLGSGSNLSLDRFGGGSKRYPVESWCDSVFVANLAGVSVLSRQTATSVLQRRDSFPVKVGLLSPESGIFSYRTNQSATYNSCTNNKISN